MNSITYSAKHRRITKIVTGISIRKRSRRHFFLLKQQCSKSKRGASACIINKTKQEVKGGQHSGKAIQGVTALPNHYVEEKEGTLMKTRAPWSLRLLRLVSNNASRYGSRVATCHFSSLRPFAFGCDASSRAFSFSEGMLYSARDCSQ